MPDKLIPTLVDSENLQCVAHHQGDLIVKFKKTGLSYRYAAVPEATYRELLIADSIGTFFHTNIVKGGFKYEKLKEDPFQPIATPV